MLELVPFKEAHREALLKLQLVPGQEKWTHHPAGTLPEVAGNPLRQAVTVLENSVPIGVFILGVDERVEWYAGRPDPQGVTLNALCLDAACQGRGVGTRVMRQLPALVGTLYPEARRVYLCVHQSNPLARHVYEKTGWQVLRVRQGKRGMLWVMRLDFRPVEPGQVA